MKQKKIFPLTIVLLLLTFLIVPHTKLRAQNDVNRKLNVAVNGFEFNEAAAKKALADGADINQKNDAMGDETLLITAVKGFKELKVIKFLIDSGADPKLKDNSGKTALDWAEQYNIGKNTNGREILKLLGSQAVKPATTQNNPAKQTPKQYTPPPVTPATTTTQNKTMQGGPSINEIKQIVEKTLTKDNENHFFGVKNQVK